MVGWLAISKVKRGCGRATVKPHPRSPGRTTSSTNESFSNFYLNQPRLMTNNPALKHALKVELKYFNKPFETWQTRIPDPKSQYMKRGDETPKFYIYQNKYPMILRLRPALCPLSATVHVTEIHKYNREEKQYNGG